MLDGQVQGTADRPARVRGGSAGSRAGDLAEEPEGERRGGYAAMGRSRVNRIVQGEGSCFIGAIPPGSPPDIADLDPAELS